MSRRTPGPWEAHNKNENRMFGWGVYSPMKIGGKCVVAENLWEADAKLIAAAPELLEACKLLVDYYNKSRKGFKLAQGYPDPSGFIENLDTYLPQLIEAIAKAESSGR